MAIDKQQLRHFLLLGVGDVCFSWSCRGSAGAVGLGPQRRRGRRLFWWQVYRQLAARGEIER